MMWHTASEPQSSALCGDAVLPDRRRPVGSGTKSGYLGERRE